MALYKNSQNGNMKNFLLPRGRRAPSREASPLESSKKRQKVHVSGTTSTAISSIPGLEPLEKIPNYNAPRSRIIAVPEMSDKILERRRLYADVLEIYFKRSRLRCLLHVFVDSYSINVEFRPVEDVPRQEHSQTKVDRAQPLVGAILKNGIYPPRVIVVVKEITDVDKERYTCRVEAAVNGMMWHARIGFDKEWVDKVLIMQWEESMSGTGTVRTSVEPRNQHEIEGVSGFFRTISIIEKPLIRSLNPVYKLLVDSWDGSHSIEAEGVVEEREVVYRGDEREKRVWLKLKLYVTKGERSRYYITVSGDVETDSWVRGRFRDDHPGKLCAK
nr:hypothetical protein CFP56_63788 [Quercus suber]